MELTVWEIFFMLLTVIPVSRMLHSIFMKLIARIGTVDEEKWGAIGLGAIGTMVGGALMLGEATTGAVGRKNFPASTIRSTGSTGAEKTEIIPGITETVISDGSEGTSSGITETPIDQGPPLIDSAIDMGSEASNKGAKTGGVFGAATSFAVPGIAAPMAALGTVSGKVVSAPVATAYNIGRTLIGQTDYASNRENMGRFEALEKSGGFKNLFKQAHGNIESVTGAKTKAGGYASMAGAVLGAPLGTGVAKHTAGAARLAGDFMANTANNMSGFWKS
jgi:hypothetical protein